MYVSHNSKNSVWMFVKSNERDARDLTPGDGGLLLLALISAVGITAPVTHTPYNSHAAPI